MIFRRAQISILVFKNPTLTPEKSGQALPEGREPPKTIVLTTSVHVK
jgi:hypothetical protein